jgi:hypothetical protein
VVREETKRKNKEKTHKRPLFCGFDGVKELDLSKNLNKIELASLSLGKSPTAPAS